IRSARQRKCSRSWMLRPDEDGEGCPARTATLSKRSFSTAVDTEDRRFLDQMCLRVHRVLRGGEFGGVTRLLYVLAHFTHAGGRPASPPARRVRVVPPDKSRRRGDRG